MPNENEGEGFGGGELTHLPGELKKWADAIKATTEAIDAVANTLEEHATRSVILEVNNTTGFALSLMGGGDHDWGGFRKLPPDQIGSHKTEMFTSQSDGFLTGTQGSVQYRVDGEGTIFHLEWSNPFIGDNECLCRVEGGRPDDYVTGTVNGGGNTNVHMRFMIGEKADASPRQRDWMSCKNCKTLFSALDEGHCAARPLGIVSAPSDSVRDLIQAQHPAGVSSAPSDFLRQAAQGQADRIPPVPTPADPTAAGMELFGNHEATDDTFQLPHGIPGPHRQGSWRRCTSCEGLFHNGQEVKGVCPGHRDGHVADTEGHNFYLVYGRRPGPSQQDNWRYCDKCCCLFFLPQNGDSVCPAGGNHHANSESYVLERG